MIENVICHSTSNGIDFDKVMANVYSQSHDNCNRSRHICEKIAIYDLHDLEYTLGYPCKCQEWAYVLAE